jgi:hypothetical protein
MKRFMMYSFAVKQRLVNLPGRWAHHQSELAGSVMKRGGGDGLR